VSPVIVHPWLCPLAAGMHLSMHSGDRDWVGQRRELPPVPESAGAARVFVRSACSDWGVDGELCDDAQLIATELVANVVDHAGTWCEMTVRAQGEVLWIEVRDFYPCPPPRPRPIDLGRRRGRGLHLVSALSTRWGVTEFSDGKSVWAVLPLPPDAAVPSAGR